MKIKEFIKLTRFEHAIMLAIAVWIGITAANGTFPQINLLILISLLVPMFSEMGSFALNDYLDIETDKLNNKTDRPLVNGTISPKVALLFSIFSITLSIIISYFINFNCFIISFLFNFAAILYNWKLKDLPLVGNIYIALSMAIPFIFGNFVISETFIPLCGILAVIGFVAGLGREIIKTVQDVEGDQKARKSKTLPILIGSRNALYIGIFLYILFIPLSIIPFFGYLKFSLISGILVLLANSLILISCFKLYKEESRQNFKLARNYSLIAFVLGLVGILLGLN